MHFQVFPLRVDISFSANITDLYITSISTTLIYLLFPRIILLLLRKKVMILYHTKVSVSIFFMNWPDFSSLRLIYTTLQMVYMAEKRKMEAGMA